MRVLVVDDSAFMRKAVSNMLSSDPEIEIVGIGRNGHDAVRLAEQLKPDLITLDIEMPEMDGLTALRQIMRKCPTHVIMLSSLTTEGSTAALRALSLGASDIMAKDQSQIALSITNMQDDLIARAKAVTHKTIKKKKKLIPTETPHDLDEIPKFKASQFDMICIGSSTGGPPVLEKILSELPADLRIPIVIAQHMPQLFTESMAKRLNDMCPLPVQHVSNFMKVETGHVYIAPGGLHTQIEKRGFRQWVMHTSEEPKSEVYRPSVNVLLESAAKNVGSRTLGIILTGMGNDGFQGGRILHENGGKLVAQSEETCVVYGMPKGVTENGLISGSLGPADISKMLQSLAYNSLIKK